jgi:hypothetical protein
VRRCATSGVIVGLVLTALAAAAADRHPLVLDSAEAWQGLRYGYEHAFDGADILVAGDVVWTATIESLAAVVPRIVLRHEAHASGRSGSKHDAGPPRPIETLVGTSPSLLELDHAIGLVYRSVAEGDGSVLLFRQLDLRSNTWSTPARVDSAHGRHHVESGRLVRASDGSLVVPVLCLPENGQSRVELCVSRDLGQTWHTLVTSFTNVSMPAVASTAAGLVLIGNREGTLVRSVSTDVGRSWSPPMQLPISTMKSPHALRRVDRNTLMLAWTEPKPSNAHTPPRIQSLLCSTSTDAGETWSVPVRLVTRPGVIPAAPALCRAGERLELVFEQRQPQQGQERVTVDPRKGQPKGKSRQAGRAKTDSRLAAALEDGGSELRESLRILAAHTLARPERSRTLFVEAYFMRTLVHARAALQPFTAEGEPWLDMDAGLQQAIAFADSQLAAQWPTGYWPIGYKEMHFADMATLVGLFHALEPHVDAERIQRYQKAVQAFVAALRRDRMLDAEGGVNGGFGRAHEPLLVSTALAGVQAHAWLFAQTREEPYRETAKAALQFILDRIASDGSLTGYAGETPLWNAVYVQEGFIAADVLLDDSDLHKSMRPALSRHVDWVLGFQQDDGSWDTGVAGERLRTNLIVNFLVWYHERIEPRKDVLAAIRRSMPSFTYDALKEKQAYDKHAEILRALSGISLAAMIQGRAVF